MSEDQEEYLVPLQDQRVFGAGIKRKRVQFVPAADETKPETASTIHSQAKGESVASFYESLVLAPRPKESSIVHEDGPRDASKEQSDAPPLVDDGRRCDICHLPISTTDPTSRPHESSLAHQVCLEHSFPPSHLDPRNKGLQYLSTYGWDPNSRLGLGPSGEGRLFPVKTAAKNDTLGVGAKLPKPTSNSNTGATSQGAKVGQAKKKETLDAKAARKKDDEDRKKTQRLHDLFYQSDEVNRYLGTQL